MRIEFDFKGTSGSNQALDLSGAKELTFGNGAAVQVAFQVRSSRANVGQYLSLRL
jgi:hypothetical protein